MTLLRRLDEDDVEGFNVRVEGGACGDVVTPVGVNVVGSFAKGRGEGLFSKADDFGFTGKEGFHLYSVLSVPRAARAGRIKLIRRDWVRRGSNNVNTSLCACLPGTVH